MENKYQFVKDIPNWVEKISDVDLVEFSKETPETLAIKHDGKGVCQVYRSVVHASDTEDTRYMLRMWALSNPDIMQTASIEEILLRDNERVDIHRVVIIRNGELKDLKDSVMVRVFDDEKASSYGSIHKFKKVNIVINDLRTHDSLVFEYSIIAKNHAQNSIDVEYFRHVQYLPVIYWFYQDYSFKFIQNRSKEVAVAKRYFRDKDGERLSEDSIVLKKGQEFVFETKELGGNYDPNVFNPYIEMATVATWPEISSYLHEIGNENKVALPKETDMLTLLNIEAGDDIEKRIRSVIEYVQDQIVYLYDADIMHGHIPQDPSKTLESRSGDCKAKSALLVQLLGWIGVKAELMAVNYGQDYFIPISLPSPFVFNHVIVGLKHKEKDYFVDATWTGRKGLLENRAEPVFRNFLPLSKDKGLGSKEARTTNDFVSEDNVLVDIKKGEGTFVMESIFRRETADALRTKFQKFDAVSMTQSESRFLLNALSYSVNEDTDVEKILSGATYKIITDDQDANVISTRYEAKMPEAYQKNGKLRIFKYYGSFDVRGIRDFRHKDHLFSHFIAYPQKSKVRITSDLLLNQRIPETKASFHVDNAYFSFSNSRNTSIKSAEVESIYLPKTYKEISSSDFEAVKKDYLAINDSNFGIGAVFSGPWQFLNMNPVYFILIIVIIRVFASIFQGAF